MEKIKLGIIGFGRIGKIHLENITCRFPDIEVVAIDPVYKTGSHDISDSFDVLTVEELMQRNVINAVLICAPMDTHADLIEMSARAGNIFFVKNRRTFPWQGRSKPLKL